ncbi:hypothetical protein SISSUDRAFT_1060487 [Sistotremastrum suecicum HHB10207 ss-3]|uniref:F-box domain-containing protein n=1 Tax=Sistotremastrum suecicum HHB10207 ss-3 TaxID=1314776 RepID=A0A166F4T5_9AGAM|nr:hypothetical protein SISSUDRAFT_1060487 [Sistotremastrum suecicum HHB10207 ss-3]
MPKIWRRKPRSIKRNGPTYSAFPEFADFPMDIQRMIVEVAASQSKAEALKLLLVSSSFRQWTRPMIYRCIALETPTKLWDLSTDADPEGYQYIVRLLVRSNPLLDANLLEKCHNLKYLGIIDTQPDPRWAPAEIPFPKDSNASVWARQSSISPTHITIFRANQLGFDEIDTYWHPLSIFRNCTHLELNLSFRTCIWVGSTLDFPFHRLTRLTHFAISFGVALPDAESVEMLVRKALADAHNLRVVVLLFVKEDISTMWSLDEAALRAISGDKVVKLKSKHSSREREWLRAMSADHRGTMWQQAERELEARRRTPS